MIQDMIEDSYDLVVAGLPRAQRNALGWNRVVEAASANSTPARKLPERGKNEG
jgi:hypothetical protein